jgi:methylphosphotriester-DNA--protein-cysteine methyltransferase
MTFVEYARARRMGLAMKQIRGGEAVIEAQLSTGYESSSGFREACRILLWSVILFPIYRFSIWQLGQYLKS